MRPNPPLRFSRDAMPGRRWLALALIAAGCAGSVPSLASAQGNRPGNTARDTTRITDIRTRTPVRAVTSVLPNGGARPPATASYCSAAQTPAGPLMEAPLSLLLAQPDCQPCPRPGLNGYYHTGPTCLLPRALNATMTAWDLPLTADPRDINADATGSAPGPNAYPIITNLFDWGDGNSASVASPGPWSHSYAADGTYNVCVTVSNAGDTPATACQAITVTTPCPVPALESQIVACPILAPLGSHIEERIRNPMLPGCPFGPWVTTVFTCAPLPTPFGTLILNMSGDGGGSGTSTSIPSLLTPGLTKSTPPAVSGSYPRVALAPDVVTFVAAPGSELASVTGCPGPLSGPLPAPAGTPITCTIPAGADAMLDISLPFASVNFPSVNANHGGDEETYSWSDVNGAAFFGVLSGPLNPLIPAGAGSNTSCNASYTPATLSLTVSCMLDLTVSPGTTGTTPEARGFVGVFTRPGSWVLATQTETETSNTGSGAPFDLVAPSEQMAWELTPGAGPANYRRMMTLTYTNVVSGDAFSLASSPSINFGTGPAAMTRNFTIP